MFAVSQIIERNLSRRASDANALWINPDRDDGWRSVSYASASLRLFSQDFGAYQYLKLAGADAEFSSYPGEDGAKYQWIIVNLPRQKALLNMILDCAASLLDVNGTLWLAGENKAGIKSAIKYLRLYFGQVRKLDSARHCTLFEASEVCGRLPFNPLTYRQKWSLDCANGGVEITSYPGVFAHGKLDAGTRLLMDSLAGQTISGDVLDFACGAGVIGVCLAARHTETRLTLLDTSALALRSCRETLVNNGLKANLLASDGLCEVEESFDLVVSNPPIHSGVKTDNQLGIRLLDTVFEHIRPGGRLILVANIHLPYEKWLSKKTSYITELASDDKYKVIMAKR